MDMFAVKTKIYMGEHSLAQMKELPMKKAYIVCDPFMKQSGMIDQITDILAEIHVQYEIFAEVIPDPTIEVVSRAVSRMLKFVPDTVIAFGGGSAIDTAKAVNYMYGHMQSHGKVCLLAIPTTSGTGSEVTSFSVISDPQTGAKYPLVSGHMLPDAAFLDPGFTLSVPPHITADTGIDVLTHALEAYVSTKAQDFTDACAEKAIRLAWRYLEVTVKDGANLDARMHMHNASCLAGIAFNEASLGICHSLAHALGGRFHIPHGRSNAMLLPYVISYNAGLDTSSETSVLRRYGEIAEMLGIWGSSEKSSVHLLIQKIKNLIRQSGIPQYVTDLGIEHEAFAAAVPEMAKLAMDDRCTKTNPVIPDPAALEAIYMQLAKGGGQ